MKVSRNLVIALLAEAIILAALLTVALDQYVHAQGEMSTGLNTWGYRGAIARERAYDETRLMMIGGTRAFQPGVPVLDTASARVRYMVEQWVTFDHGPVTAINLGLPGVPRGSYADRLDAFRGLAPDLICIYPDLSPAAQSAPRGLVTKLTGYSPALTLFSAVDRSLGRIAGAEQPVSDDIGAVASAVETALSIAPGVVVAIPEPATSAEMRERDTLVAALSRFASDRRVTIVPLKDGPPVRVADVLQPADVVQIEPAVSAMLRAQRAYK